jgi:hypothetical protein
MWHLGCNLRRQILLANGVLLFKSYADCAVLGHTRKTLQEACQALMAGVPDLADVFRLGDE